MLIRMALPLPPGDAMPYSVNSGQLNQKVASPQTGANLTNSASEKIDFKAHCPRISARWNPLDLVSENPKSGPQSEDRSPPRDEAIQAHVEELYQAELRSKCWAHCWMP
jgi:hypothetical protein